jgi:hypothetical protein
MRGPVAWVVASAACLLTACSSGLVPTLGDSDQAFCEQQEDDDGMSAVRSNLTELREDWDGVLPTLMWKDGFEMSLAEAAEFLTPGREAGVEDEELRTTVREVRNDLAAARTAVVVDSMRMDTSDLRTSLDELAEYCAVHG